MLFTDHSADRHLAWTPGAMATGIDELQAKLATWPFSRDFESIRYIKGFFEDALTPALREELAAYPPGIVTIDVDFYTSTRTVLDWLQPIINSGALL